MNRFSIAAALAALAAPAAVACPPCTPCPPPCVIVCPPPPCAVCPPPCWPIAPVLTRYRTGARVTAVFYERTPPSDRPAGNASPLRAGDTIVEVGGVRVADADQLGELLAAAAGKVITMKVLDPATNKVFFVSLDLTARETAFGVKAEPATPDVTIDGVYFFRPIA